MKKAADKNAVGKNAHPPGYYGRKKMSASDWIELQAQKWQEQEAERKNLEDFSQQNCICLSRGIGVGALEVAEFLSERTGYRVIDREIMEYMANDSTLTEKIIEFYDERVPGRMRELLAAFSIEKKIYKNDYIEQLAKTVTALAHVEPTIFVGRGSHLILPRQTILSVQLICSKKRRIERLSNMLGVDKGEAEKQLNIMDDEHHEFFRAIYLREKISSDEFDLVINMDFFDSGYPVAQIIACAFEHKFQTV
jgi:cytidylate kinase